MTELHRRDHGLILERTAKDTKLDGVRIGEIDGLVPIPRQMGRLDDLFDVPTKPRVIASSDCGDERIVAGIVYERDRPSDGEIREARPR